MKVLLFEDSIYYPSFGGGNKSNRMLMENLAAEGHECMAVSRSHNSSGRFSSRTSMLKELDDRSVSIIEKAETSYSFCHKRVNVLAIQNVKKEKRLAIARKVGAVFNPDIVLIDEDNKRRWLECVLTLFPGKVVMLGQTIINLPFGPLSLKLDTDRAQQMLELAGILVISNFSKQYFHKYLGKNASLIPIPVYGQFPFNNYGNFDQGYITMINPCKEKGLEIFIELAKNFPSVSFAAVPTWGADQNAIAQLNAQENITLLKPMDEIDDIFKLTRILVVPSLLPETFGLVATEAMLRGIPVLASDSGGLPEAKLGVDYIIPVEPVSISNGAFEYGVQNIEPWVSILHHLLTDEHEYYRVSLESKNAAISYVGQIKVDHFIHYFESLLSNAKVS